jgi:hypothetical protein
MLTRKEFTTSIEIKFWQTIIPMMEASPLIKLSVAMGYSAIQSCHTLHWLLKTLLWAGSGWIFGLVIGLFTGLIR